MNCLALHLTCSFFEHAKDNHPRAWEGSWEALQGLLDRNWEPSPSLVASEPKIAQPAFSGASYRPGALRACGNVVSHQLLIMDFDNAKEEETGQFHVTKDGRTTNRPVLRKVPINQPVLPTEVAEALRQRGVASYLYTTWSHTPSWPRFRLVVPVDKAFPPDVLEQVAEYGFAELGLELFRRGVDLPVLRDTARIHFLPSIPPGGILERWKTDGEPLSLDLEKLGRVRVKPPELSLWQRRILVKRALEGRWDLRYSIDLRTLDLAGLLKSRGIEVGEARPYFGATKWRTHCPWANEHSQGLDDDSAVIIHEPGRFPIWRCAHSHHAHLRLRDILEWAGGAK